jgi:probable HAF family extracellular repeat protein
MKFTRLMSLNVLALLISILLVAHWLPAQDERHRVNPTHYTVQNLGSLGGTNCCTVITINDRGWVDGTSYLAGDKSFHPFLWINGQMSDLGTLGGPNASVGGMNDVGDVTVGGADTTTPDPLGEDWCGFGTYLICRSYVWRNGRRTLVPTLGGNNGDVSGITNVGLVFGFAETAIDDPTCIPPEVLGFEAFVWNPDQNEIRVLPPLPGDTVSAGGINEYGEGAGTSGICGHGIALTSALHAVVWKNGVPSDIGSLGGSFGNLANSINNQGQVVGQSDLAGDTTFHGFLWIEDEGLKDLGTLPGDVFSTANSVNDDGQIAMQSCDANFNCRAAVWQNGVMTDLNTLTAPGSSLFLLLANSINAQGQIVGAALDQSTGAVVPFLANPDANGAGDTSVASSSTQVAGNQTVVTLPENVRKLLQRRLRFSGFRVRR